MFGQYTIASPPLSISLGISVDSLDLRVLSTTLHRSAPLAGFVVLIYREHLSGTPGYGTSSPAANRCRQHFPSVDFPQNLCSSLTCMTRAVMTDFGITAAKVALNLPLVLADTGTQGEMRYISNATCSYRGSKSRR